MTLQFISGRKPKTRPITLAAWVEYRFREPVQVINLPFDSVEDAKLYLFSFIELQCKTDSMAIRIHAIIFTDISNPLEVINRNKDPYNWQT